jgi:hypothetical protein
MLDSPALGLSYVLTHTWAMNSPVD